MRNDYPTSVVEKHLSEVKFSDRKASLKQKNRDASTVILPIAILPAFTQLKDVTHEEMAPHTDSTTTKRNRKGKSLKDILFRTKL